MTEQLPFHFSLPCIGEGNGNPLQCSCLENPRDGEAWWAAVYGVAQRRTRLKQLSSSSSQRVNIEHIKMKFNSGEDKLETENLFQFSVDLNLNLLFYKKLNLSAKFIECIMYTFKFKHFSYLRICNNSDFRCYMVFLNTMKFRKKMWHFIFIRHRKYAKYHYSHLHIWTKSIISKYILRMKYNTFKHLDLLCCA